MKEIIVLLALVTTVAKTLADRLIGEWQTPVSENGNVTSVIFKPDSTFEGFVNYKHFVSGTYTLKDSVFTMRDNGCNGVIATYNIIFFSNEDSIRFKPLNDSCVGRRNGMSKTVLGRVKHYK